MSDIDIIFGAYAPPIKMQLKTQGITSIEDFFLKVFQEHDNAINRLLIHAILPQSEADKCREVLKKKIINLINEKQP